MTERMNDEVFEEVVRELHAGKISARKLLEDELRRARESEARLREDYRRAVSDLSNAVVERDMWQEKLRAKIAQLDETMDQRDAAIVALDAARMEIAGMRQSALHKQSGALLREMKQVKDKLDRAFAVAERATNELESALAERAQMLRTIELAKACRDEGEKGLTAALKQVRVPGVGLPTTPESHPSHSFCWETSGRTSSPRAGTTRSRRFTGGSRTVWRRKINPLIELLNGA